MHSELIPLEDFAVKYPMFDQLLNHPLIPNCEAACLLSERWQQLIHSLARIGEVNLRKGCTVAESYRKSNVLVHQRYNEAYLARPTGRRYRGLTDATRGLTYSGLANLLEDMAASHQPTARRPKDYQLMVDLMRSPRLTAQLEQVVVYNPWLLPATAYASYIYHIDHLARRFLFLFRNSKDDKDRFKFSARRSALEYMASMIGQDDQHWLEDVKRDRFLWSIYLHILGVTPNEWARRHVTGQPTDILPLHDDARGAAFLNVGRSQLVHGWTPSIVNDRFVNPSGRVYTMEELVQHQRWRLPGLGHSAAVGFAPTTEHEATQLPSFFPPGRLYHLEQD
jgi:hypothetical protein